MEILDYNFYDRDTEVVAKELLGKILVRRHVDGTTQVARIVETEAYLGPHDLAAHSSKGNTQRTKILFDKAGRVYVYLIYGIHILMNITTGPAGAAVLLRALEPIENITGKTNGPGSLTKSLNIDLSFYGVDVTDPASNITVYADVAEPFDIVETTRIGVDYAGVWAAENLRYYIKDNPYVSKR